MMKFIVCLLGALVVYAGCPCEQSHNYQKTYVSPEQISFAGKEIWVNPNGDSVKIDAIFSDEEGLYFNTLQSSKKEEKCESPKWKCTYCSQCNEVWYSRCPKCHTWR